MVLESGSDKVRLSFTGYPRTMDGTASNWQVCLTYEVYREGAVFADMQCHLREGEFALHHAEASFQVADAILNAPKFSDENVGLENGGFRSARIAFGMHADKSFTNEAEVVCEYKQAMTGTPVATKEKGRYTWTLGGGGGTLTAPYSYHNRFALGLGSAVNGPPRSNAVGHRVYHWVNWLDLDDWYPSNEQIDRMVAHHGTMLILHHEYLLQRGSNGKPHAEYSALRDHDEMVRTINHAHVKGLRVGLYMRGVERYALNSAWLERFCRRNWDGLYVDWHGHSAVSWHEMKYAPESGVGDWHFSLDGTHVPARDYFLFTKRLREMVGPDGFLIGHQGSFSGGVLPNLCFDAYLPGETSSDHRIFADVDQAALKGMLGGGVCMPWMLDLALYCNAEGAAKMAAWGFYPHLVMGISRNAQSPVFPLDPDDSLYAFVQPYWRVLAQVTPGTVTAHNLVSQPATAMTSSEPAVTGVVYSEENGRFVVIVANQGKEPANAELTLDPGCPGSGRGLRGRAY